MDSAFSITWAPEERLATILLNGTHLGGETARDIIEIMRGQLAPGAGWGAGYTRALFFAPELVAVDAEWRALWADFFREHAGAMSMAVVGLSPVLRVVVRMYSMGTGMSVQAFAREEEARAWLAGGDR
jgi:hypothetical protein